MDALDALMTRRSVREFTAEPVTDEQIQTMLSAAMHAPSACNQQPWHFVVVTEREKLNAYGAHDFTAMLLQAPLAVFICADLTLETCPGNWVIDCSAAMENLLLAVHALGLGAVWVGVHPNPEHMKDVREMLKLPGYIEPLSLAVIGHAKEPLPKVDRFNAGCIHTNVW